MSSKQTVEFLEMTLHTFPMTLFDTGDLQSVNDAFICSVYIVKVICQHLSTCNKNMPSEIFTEKNVNQSN